MSYFDELRKLYANELYMNYLQYIQKTSIFLWKFQIIVFIQTLSLFSDKRELLWQHFNRIKLNIILCWDNILMLKN